MARIETSNKIQVGNTVPIAAGVSTSAAINSNNKEGISDFRDFLRGLFGESVINQKLPSGGAEMDALVAQLAEQSRAQASKSEVLAKNSRDSQQHDEERAPTGRFGLESDAKDEQRDIIAEREREENLLSNEDVDQEMCSLPEGQQENAETEGEGQSDSAGDEAAQAEGAITDQVVVVETEEVVSFQELSLLTAAFGKELKGENQVEEQQTSGQSQQQNAKSASKEKPLTGFDIASQQLLAKDAAKSETTETLNVAVASKDIASKASENRSVSPNGGVHPSDAKLLEQMWAKANVQPGSQTGNQSDTQPVVAPVIVQAVSKEDAKTLGDKAGAATAQLLSKRGDLQAGLLGASVSNIGGNMGSNDASSIGQSGKESPLNLSTGKESSVLREQAGGDKASVKGAESTRTAEMMEKVQKVLLQAAQSNNGTNSIVIRLDPPHLGELTVKVSFRGDDLNARISTDSKEVEGILKGKVGELSALLSSTGVAKDNINVVVAPYALDSEATAWLGSQGQQISTGAGDSHNQSNSHSNSRSNGESNSGGEHQNTDGNSNGFMGNLNGSHINGGRGGLANSKPVDLGWVA